MSIPKNVAATDTAFICKECGYIIKREEMVFFVKPSNPAKVAAQIGHETTDETECVSGRTRILEDYSVGKLINDVTHRLFLYYNFLGTFDWWTLPNTHIHIADNTMQVIPKGTSHAQLMITDKSELGLGLVEVRLATMTDADAPVGIDVFLDQTHRNSAIKLTGFQIKGGVAIDLYFNTRNHHASGCWCGEEIGWLLSSGDFLTTSPII